MEGKEGNVFNFFEGSQYVGHIDTQTNNYNFYGGGKQSGCTDTILTEDELMERVANVRTLIGNTNRLWFPVCKYMMWRKMVPEGDFNSAVKIIEKLYPEVSLNPDDLSSLNVLSFKKTLDEWDVTNAPVKGTTFNKYYTIAELISK